MVTGEFNGIFFSENEAGIYVCVFGYVYVNLRVIVQVLCFVCRGQKQV